MKRSAAMECSSLFSFGRCRFLASWAAAGCFSAGAGFAFSRLGLNFAMFSISVVARETDLDWMEFEPARGPKSTS